MSSPLESPEIGHDLYIYINHTGRIVRTGILLYYDPLYLSDMYDKTLAELSVVDHTLPDEMDLSDLEDFPYSINAHLFDLIIERVYL
jgi:hypothetical protein